MITDEIFELVSFKTHREPHIKVDGALCAGCGHRACTFTCPARCYEWNRGEGQDRLQPTKLVSSAARA